MVFVRRHERGWHEWIGRLLFSGQLSQTYTDEMLREWEDRLLGSSGSRMIIVVLIDGICTGLLQGEMGVSWFSLVILLRLLYMSPLPDYHQSSICSRQSAFLCDIIHLESYHHRSQPYNLSWSSSSSSFLLCCSALVAIAALCPDSPSSHWGRKKSRN